ncbi:MAG: VWA domain-containing protein [Gammaproteobacteria bacterium]
MSEWHLLRPWWLLALPLALMAIWWYGRRRQQAGRWRDVVDDALQPYVLTSGRETREGRALPLWLALITAVLIVALAGPVRERLPQPVYRNESALVIALDLSRSMNAQDLLPTRLERARLKVRDLLSQREEGDTALLVFAGDAFTVTPLTDDTGTIEAMLESLTTQIMPRQGSLVAPALTRAARLFEDAGATEGRVLLIADGVADRAAATEAAQKLKERGFDISVLGIGTPEGDVVRNAQGQLIKDDAGQIVVARTDVAALASIASAGNGRFTLLSADDTDIDALLNVGEAAFVDGVINDDFETDVWREEGPLLVLMCLPLLALFFRRGLIIGVAAFMLIPPPTASAGLWDDLWKTPDQQAREKFLTEDFDGATEQFVDPKWQSAAAYRAQDYERSAKLLEGVQTQSADTFYNRGNALALAGEIDAAKNAYKAALSVEPDHEDAQYNLDLLDQLPPQEDQSEQSQDGDEGEQSEQGDQQDQGDSGDPGDSQQSEAQEDGDGSSQNPDTSEGDEEGDPASAQEDGEGEQTDEQRDAAGDPESGENEESQSEQMDAQAGQSDEEKERDLAAEQWLRQVPDDPGGLLRRKFERQYRLRYQGRPEEDQAW